MGYVDLRRREGRAREKRGRESLWQAVEANPLFPVAGGFTLGVLATWSVVSTPEGYTPLVVHLPLILIALAGMGFWRLRRERRGGTGPKFGAEKQLLLAIRGAGGRITPVEAALETSLTVDEAEEILTRFADRGHLLIEGRNGVLYYALPGARTRGLGDA